MALGRVLVEEFQPEVLKWLRERVELVVVNPWVEPQRWELELAHVDAVISRKGKEFEVNGETSIISGAELKVTTERDELNVSIGQLEAGGYVILEIPGFTKAASGTEVGSLDALRKASATSYYKAKDALWVKVVSPGGSGQGPGGLGAGAASIQVSRK